MRNELTLPYIYLITIWFANINDLIRGSWFYHNMESIIFWNFIGIMSIIYIILSYRNKNEGGKEIKKFIQMKGGKKTK